MVFHLKIILMIILVDLNRTVGTGKLSEVVLCDIAFFGPEIVTKPVYTKIGAAQLCNERSEPTFCYEIRLMSPANYF